MARRFVIVLMLGIFGCTGAASRRDAGVGPDGAAPPVDAAFADAAPADGGTLPLPDASGSIDAGRGDPLRFENPCLSDVEAAFAALPERGAELRVWAGEVDDVAGLIPWPRYTDTVQNRLGFNNHLQGAQRLRGHDALVVTGGDVQGSTGHLFVLDLGSRPRGVRWSSNLGAGPPPREDRVVARVDLDSAHWHAGGPAALGDLVAIPMEGDGRSTIIFYDLSEPIAPRLLDVTIERAHAQAAAVALTRVDDDRVLAAVRTDSMVELYLSISPDIEDGFGPDAPPRWEHGGLGISGGFANAQNMNLLRQCDGALYLTGFWNTAPGIPTIPGSDDAVLLRLRFETGDFAELPTFEERATRQFRCEGACNFDAVAGLYVTDDRQLLLYGTRHYREREGGATVIRMREF